MASVSIEDFFKNVFTLINLGGKVTTTKLSGRLNVSNAAITDMSRKLAQQNLINEIDKFPGYPETDPHGDPIPDELGNLVEQAYVCILEISTPATLFLRRIIEPTNGTMTYLNQVNISLGRKLVVAGIDIENQVVDLSVSVRNIQMPFIVAKKMFVESKK